MVYIKKYNLETRKSEKLKNTLCYHVCTHQLKVPVLYFHVSINLQSDTFSACEPTRNATFVAQASVL